MGTRRWYLEAGGECRDEADEAALLDRIQNVLSDKRAGTFEAFFETAERGRVDLRLPPATRLTDRRHPR